MPTQMPSHQESRTRPSPLRPGLCSSAMQVEQFTTVGLRHVDRYMQRLQEAVDKGEIGTAVVAPVFSSP